MKLDKLVKLVNKETKFLLGLFLVLYIIFQIVFYKQNFMTVLKTVISLFWVFILPGYFLMLYWHKKIGLLERLVAGTLLSAALIGITSYYVGIAGLNVNFHSIILPPMLIAIGFLVNLKTDQ